MIPRGTLDNLASFKGVPRSVIATLASRGTIVRYPAERVIFAAPQFLSKYLIRPFRDNPPDHERAFEYAP